MLLIGLMVVSCNSGNPGSQGQSGQQEQVENTTQVAQLEKINNQQEIPNGLEIEFANLSRTSTDVKQKTEVLKIKVQDLITNLNKLNDPSNNLEIEAKIESLVTNTKELEVKIETLLTTMQLPEENVIDIFLAEAKRDIFKITTPETSNCKLKRGKNTLDNDSSNITATVNEKFQITVVSKVDGYLYVKIPNPKDGISQRWVSAKCGVIIQGEGSGNGGGSTKPQQCIQKPGHADSYVLAASWQSGFCETGAGSKKAECVELKKKSANVQQYATQFSLHGLWPNQAACGTNYGFCNTKKQSSHCDYSKLNLDQSSSDLLSAHMASYEFGSCLERHEWYKHGTCQNRSANEYYTISVNFIKELNASEFSSTYIKNNIGRKVSTKEVYENFNKSFGDGASKKIKLMCSGDGDVLTDIYINLPNIDPLTEFKLGELIKAAKDVSGKGNCGDTFEISDFGLAS